MTWATDRLVALVSGAADLPPVVHTLRPGALDDRGEGRVIARIPSAIRVEADFRGPMAN